MKRRKVLVVEFSGGLTSALMAKLVLKWWNEKHQALAAYDDLVFLFCNTGLEDPRTLDFVHRVNVEFLERRVIWLEAVVNPVMHKGTGFKIVTYETACRDKSIYDAVCAKYGLPNKYYPHCTREMKQRPIEAYMRMFDVDYDCAVGIRADEPGRLPTGPKPGFIYPLAHILPVTKAVVRNHWAGQPFTLEVPEHLGNCTFCFKKSKRKKLTIAKEHPELVTPWLEMEHEHGRDEDDRDRFNVRDSMYIADYLAQAQQPFEPFRPGLVVYDANMDVESGCLCR